MVSIIIPAFNAAETLRETIESVLAGTYAAVEVIIVDDGSLDTTATIADEFVRANSRVRLHRQSNRGLAGALNAGFALARGEYIARLDADDLWHPAKLERQMEVAARSPDAAFIYTFVRYIDGESRVVRDGPAQRFARHALCRGLYESLVGGGSSALIRRSAVAEVGGCDERLRSWEDLVLQLQISARHEVEFVPEYLVGYRVRPGSLSSDPANMHRQWRRARKQIRTLFPQVPRWVDAWAHGRRCAMFAEGFAWRGSLGSAAALLLEALRHDPIGTGRLLQYRSARRLKRRRSPPMQLAAGPLFSSCRPQDIVRPDPFDLAPEAQRLRTLEAKRIRRLEAVDRKLADAFAATPRSRAAADEGSSPAPPAHP